ncbi:MAG: tetratricopeptide repeat protein [Rhodospirillaceae bacterium]
MEWVFGKLVEIVSKYVTKKMEGAVPEWCDAAIDKVKRKFRSYTPLSRVPDPVVDFTGRQKEIGTLLAALRGGGQAAITALKGQGGVGKTTLALHIVPQLAEHYPGKPVIVDMRGLQSPPRPAVEAMAEIIGSVHPEAKIPDDPHARQTLYRDTLSNKSVLIILDNAADTKQVRPLVPPPGNGLLVTSRQLINLDHGTVVRLDVLPPDEAAALLCAIAPHLKPEEVPELAKLCGYLPLALRVAGSFLKLHPNRSVKDYLKLLQDERQRLTNLTNSDNAAHNVEAVLALSIQQLRNEKSELAQRWQELSVFPSDFDRDAVAAVWKLESESAEADLTELYDRSLVIWDEGLQRYRLHDLLRALAVPATGTDAWLDMARLRHARYFHKLLKTADDLYLARHDKVLEGLRLYDREAANIAAAAAWAVEHWQSDTEAARIAARMPSDGGNIYNMRLSPTQWIALLEPAVNAARKIGDRPAEGNALGNLGIAYDINGEPKRAIANHEQSLVISRAIGDRKGESADLGNLGIAYGKLGEYQRAIEHYQQQLDLARAPDIGDRPGEGRALGNLGNAYSALGQRDRAIECYEQRLVIARAPDIGDRRGEGIALWNMADEWNLLGDREQAIALARQALVIYEELKAPNTTQVRAALAAWTAETKR